MNTPLNAYAIPGIGFDEQSLIRIITHEFGFSTTDWVRTRLRDLDIKVARQLLMTCLMDHCGYTQSQSGAVCMRDHATALHSARIVKGTLWNDRQYGERIRYVYNECRAVQRKILYVPAMS